VRIASLLGHAGIEAGLGGTVRELERALTRATLAFDLHVRCGCSVG
jgi:hypothetical protein